MLQNKKHKNKKAFWELIINQTILMRKKLFVDAHTFDENHQGIRTFLKGIYNAIDVDPKKLQIVLAANNIENLKQEFKNQKNFEYLKLNSKNRYIRLAYEIPKLIKRHQFDFAHFNYFLPLFLNKKCKYIVTIHDVLFLDFPQYFPLKYRITNTFLYRRSALKAKVVTTVSEYSSKRIKHHFKLNKKEIIILPNAVSNKFLKERDKNIDVKYVTQKYGLSKYILYVSRIEPRKNHLILVEAYKDLELWKQNIDLVFIGSESFNNDELNNSIKFINEKTEGKVLKFKDIANDELVRFYNASTISVFLSLCEGFGIPPIESAVLKTPTICSNATAMSDFDFFEDFLIDPNSKEKIMRKILEILREMSECQSIESMEVISKKIKELYSWKKTASILLQKVSSY